MTTVKKLIEVYERGNPNIDGMKQFISDWALCEDVKDHSIEFIAECILNIYNPIPIKEIENIQTTGGQTNGNII